MRALTMCGAALLVAGCSTTTQGAAVMATSTAPAALFNPCDIPDDALRAAGVDPGTEESGIAGATFDGWEVCAWEAPAEWYYLRIFATTHTLAEMRENSALTQFEDTTIGSRRGVLAVDKGSETETCNFAFETSEGLLMVNIDTKYLLPRPEEPCVTTRAKTLVLDANFPE
ncbi:DUF3558 domain-containing protein [Antrihabitans sp. YC3-6]|uniref:DUF3558 domain-containing protein n=1 Tax=Antrihabitans stalagmiti TaxID=2799499 RepID=A0A934U572_9NOCA|nr:DUF3558 domain-containing protein [Antrihabitans stalagmiti]